MKYYDGFVLIRILQALGAYGFRGYYENKPHFLQSIPYAMKNLATLIDRDHIPVDLPILSSVLLQMIHDPRFAENRLTESNLTVKIFSFSCKHAMPVDETENGGGFIFDCRALPNPGKCEEYKTITGKDQPVIDFLKKEVLGDGL